MKQLERLRRAFAFFKGFLRGPPLFPVERPRSSAEDVCRAHRPEVGDDPRQRRVRCLNPVDVDDRTQKPGIGEQSRKSGRLDPRVDVRSGSACNRIGGPHCCAKPWERVASAKRSHEQSFRSQRVPNELKRDRQVVERIERSDGEDQIASLSIRMPCIFDDRGSARPLCEQHSRIAHVDGPAEPAQSSRPRGIRAADQQCATERSVHQAQPVETILERSLQQKQLRADASRTVASHRTQVHVEQVRHAALVRCACAGDKNQ